MPVPKIVARTGHATVSGVLGIVAVEGIKRWARPERVRSGAVTATSWALRGRRRAEEGAETVRLAGADILAEARARNGEVAPPPGHDATGAAGHHHDH